MNLFILGGLTGAAVGHLEGLLLGELVEIADKKLKKKTTPMLKVSSSDRVEGIGHFDDQITHPYHVLQHIVLKFKKNVLDESNFDHLTLSNSIFYTNEGNASKAFNHLISNAHEKINEDDYEIYVINKGSDEIINIDLEETLSENGRITSRFSVEEFSADQLPTDINIFFRYDDNQESI
jgi:hypothetical protein